MKVNVTKQVIVKFIELVVVCILISLLYHSTIAVDFDHVFLACGTYLGYLIILSGLLLGGILDKPVDYRVDLLYSLVGCALFIAVGAIFVQDPYKSLSSKKEVIKGYISIILGIGLFADAVSVILSEMT